MWNSHKEWSAEEYLRIQCEHGFSLGEHAAARVPWHAGSFGMIRRDAFDRIDGQHRGWYRSGGELPTPKVKVGRGYLQFVDAAPISRRKLVDVIGVIAALPSMKNAFLICEDLISQLSGEFDRFPICRNGEEQYGVCPNLGEAKLVESCIDGSDNAALSIGFIVNMPFPFPHTSSIDIDSSFIEEVSEQIVFVYARAFDLEGYLIWCRNDFVDINDVLKSFRS